MFLIGSDGDHLILYDREWRALLANIKLPQNEIKRNHPLFFQPFNLTATTPAEDWVDINNANIFNNTFIVKYSAGIYLVSLLTNKVFELPYLPDIEESRWDFEIITNDIDPLKFHVLTAIPGENEDLICNIECTITSECFGSE